VQVFKKKPWITLDKPRFKTVKSFLLFFKKKKIFLSPWIVDIFKKKKFKNVKYPVRLYKVKVTDLGFNVPTELKNIYSKLKQKGFKLLAPEYILLARLKYLNQKKGNWIRFATPLNSMIDRDGVPHLPKLGSALGFLFIETYWSYPKAIFYPHNEFVVTR